MGLSSPSLTSRLTLRMTLDAAVEDVEAAKEVYRRDFAEFLNVPLEWVLTEVAGGSVVVTFTIRRPAAFSTAVDLATVVEQAGALNFTALFNASNVEAPQLARAAWVTRSSRSRQRTCRERA